MRMIMKKKKTTKNLIHRKIKNENINVFNFILLTRFFYIERFILHVLRQCYMFILNPSCFIIFLAYIINYT